VTAGCSGKGIPEVKVLDPVELQRIALAALSAGGIVMFGAAYAVCLALGRLKSLSILRSLAYFAYLAMVAVTGLFAWAMNLTGWWAVLTIVLLVGYFVAPRAIWRLSVATHESSESDTATGGGGGGNE